MEDAVLIKKKIILSTAEISSSVVALVVVVQSLWSLTARLILLLKCDPFSFVVLDGWEKESAAINQLIINNSSEFIFSGL